MGQIAVKLGRARQTTPRVPTDIQSIPAPILGLNSRDSLGDMDPRFALRMDNYFPDGGEIKLRKGTEDHVTGIVGPVETLHTFAAGTVEKLIAFANNSAYDVTGGGTVGAPLASGFTNNRWIGINAGANGGETALYANGIDAVQAYDGTTWSTPTITGPINPNSPALAQKRVWFIEEGTGEAWYGGIEATSGTFNKFDIGSVHPAGGPLIAIGDLTVDGGDGPNDLTVFVMKSGAVVLYAGTDPSDAATWSLVGVWNAGNPIGNRCLVPFDKDLILISDQGFQSLLSFTTGGGISGVPISDTIRRDVSDASLLYESNFGWNGLYHPHQRQLIFNVPILEGKTSQQFVMNSIGKAWCRFKNQNLTSQAILGHDRYLGTNGKVILADTGGLDEGQEIIGEVQTAWNYFGSRGIEKHFKQYRPNVRSDTSISLAVGIGVDFNDPRTTAISSTSVISNAVWDIAAWDEEFWAGGLVTNNDWLGAGDLGYNSSVLFKTQTANAEVQILATDFLFERGSAV